MKAFFFKSKIGRSEALSLRAIRFHSRFLSIGLSQPSWTIRRRTWTCEGLFSLVIRHNSYNTKGNNLFVLDKPGKIGGQSSESLSTSERKTSLIDQVMLEADADVSDLNRSHSPPSNFLFVVVVKIVESYCY